jgi:iron complex outermembrane receptor protein
MQSKTVPTRNLRLLAGLYAALGTLSVGVAADAQAQTAANAPGGPALEEVIVTGTRRTDRSATESASPIDVISGAELNTQASSNMLDVVKNVVPSFFVPQNTISDASTFVRAPSLRGLPSDQVLVLLNGKRFNRSALVQVYAGGDTGLSFGSHGSDLSSIPSIAVKKLEILRDGATAQYGSDAIAGVLNYGLRDDVGFEVVARMGQYQDESDGDGMLFAANAGFEVGDDGFINLSAEYFDDDQTSRGETRPVAVAFAEENPDLADQLPHYPLPAQIWGSSPTHGFKFVLNSEFGVGENSELYFFGNYADAKTDQSFNFRSSLIGTRPFEATDGDTTFINNLGGRSFFQHPFYSPCPANNATCPEGGFVEDPDNAFLMSSLYPGGFTPRFVGENEQIFGTVGFRGEADSGLNYDFSTSLSRNTLALSMYNSISPSFGPETQTSFEFGDLIQEELNVNLDVTYEIDAGMASPLTFSAGAEYRDETFESTEGDFQSYGAGPYATANPLYTEIATGVFQATGGFTEVEDPAASGYGGTSPTYANSNSQNSYGVYLGLEGDITETVTMGAAVRYEDYETFGSEVVGKLNAIWHLTDAFSLRATFGTGFHAPSPGQNNTQILTTTFLAGESVQQGTFPVTSAVAQYYGAELLKPATATNYGAGFVLRPLDTVTLTVDWYQIDVEDRIFISQSYFVDADDILALPELASVGLNGSVQYFTNAFDTKTHGVDVVSTWAATDNLNLTLAYNYNKSEAENFDPAIVSGDQVIGIERLAPNHRGTFSGNWSLGNFGVNFRVNYYGSWIDANDYPTEFDANGRIVDGQEFGDKTTADLDLNYTFSEKYTLTVGGTNIFNTYPDKIAASANNPIYTLTGSLSDGQVYPRSGGPFGINGGYYYAALRVQF